MFSCFIWYFCNQRRNRLIMIAEFTVENFYSIRSTQKISFEPSSDSFMSDEYTYEVKDGVRLLKVNAARKSKVDDNTARMQSIKQLGV